MFDILFENARLANGEIKHIAITDKKITSIHQENGLAAKRVIDLKGQTYLSAGWIDSHVHCNPNSPIYFDDPDAIGIAGGVTTVIDAGSTGADDIDAFRLLCKKYKTNVKALLNISRIGLITQHELANLNDIDIPLAGQTICKHCEFILGIKARMSGSVIGDNGLKPLEMAKQIQRENNNIPLMVHFGNKPPMVDNILEYLGQGDILTHCYHGKPNGILTPEGQLRNATKAALDRGMVLDVGHGGASFSFKIAKQAMDINIYPNTISSDIYCKNRINGPVYGLAAVMSKFLMLGMSLEKIITSVTSNVSTTFKIANKGRLEVGYDADLTLFNISNQPQNALDSEGVSQICQQNFVPLAAVVAGELFPTREGESNHDIDL
ncbi:amidohydrolase/deacetylase family metallohydrolase [Bartonella sp. HY406]|uniref:amidohydrolase/deacetylase family metallohydrolase n=1 Tax=Bartonella sp. HY406 TaxID=2979331 RepID=UPI0021C759AF|nr:amidohydrolase/deacetylase family metallohydrolase [Bartonella sp. HY406]UXN05052.1 amidohydrolase/deacetylase family metallohydrolase [Bartonella sp. HY406]